MTASEFLVSLAERFEGSSPDLAVGCDCRKAAELAKDCRDYATILDLAKEIAEYERVKQICAARREGRDAGRVEAQAKRSRKAAV